MPSGEFDVAIIGYGPTGLSLAALLGQVGHRCVVIERWPNLYTLPRAGHVDGEIMRLFQKIGIGDYMAGHASVTRNTVILGADGQKVMDSPAEECLQGWEAHYSIFQPELEEALDRQVRSAGTIEVRQGWALRAISEHDDGVTLQIAEGTALRADWVPTGKEATLSAKWVVGADGASSTVRTYLGIEQTDFGHSSRALVVFAERLDPQVGAEMADAEVGMVPQRPYVALRSSGKRFARWEFHLHEHEDTEAMNDPDRAWELIAPWGFTPVNCRLIRNTVFEFRTLVAESWRKRRFILAGDAAHLMPPHQGQGMCSGQRDAAAIAWRLDLILRGCSHADLLDTYTPERKPHVVALTLNSAERAKAFWITDEVEAAARDEKMREASVTASKNVNLTKNYGDVPALASGILASEQGRAIGIAGHLSPQFWVACGGRTALLDCFAGFAWTLVSIDASLSAEVASDLDGLLRPLAVRSLILTPSGRDGTFADIDGQYRKWFAEQGCCALLVRPDSYIFGAAQDALEMRALIQSLATQLTFR
jgi:2-polyprenyl-6-methoxyphenol hydroxylase-like FAD-dependent oxidoreductase